MKGWPVEWSSQLNIKEGAKAYLPLIFKKEFGENLNEDSSSARDHKDDLCSII
jgi:hypothetical protein